jgi:hypothetical protein
MAAATGRAGIQLVSIRLMRRNLGNRGWPGNFGHPERLRRHGLEGLGKPPIDSKFESVR